MLIKLTSYFPKVSVILLIISMSFGLALPVFAQTETYATLELIAKDPSGNKVTNVNFAIFEQLKDINNNPVFGNRIADGYIGDIGSKIIQLKIDNDTSVNFAVEFFKNYNDFERFKIWEQTIARTQNKIITLTFSSVKIIIKDQNNNLLKDKSFDIFSTAIDANGNRVADRQIQWRQTTGILGYKIFYLIPGNYDARVNSKDYFFSIDPNQQTDLVIIVDITADPLPTGDIYTTFNLAAKNAFGDKVTNVSFIIYDQKNDINNKPVFGDRITDGYIGETGEQTVKIRMNGYASRTIAVEYFKEWRLEGRFSVWNQTIYPNQSKNINLVLSTARIVLKDATGKLLKNFNYDIYSVATDYSGKKIAKDHLYGGQQTGVIGERVYYLIPNDYILHFRYPEVSNVEDFNYLFTVNKNSQSEVVYTLSDIKVSARQANGDLKKYAEFRLYKKNNDNVYKEIGYFNTGEDYKHVYLPPGNYKIEFKDSSGNWSQSTEFTLAAGSEKEFGYSYGGFRMRVTDVAGNSLTNLKVAIYKYSDNKRQDLIAWSTTDINGKVSFNLNKGTYIAEVEGLYRNLIYQTRIFTIEENSSFEFTFPLSQANIFLRDNQNQNIYYRFVNLYLYSQDSSGNPVAGADLGTFWISYRGFIETYLPSGRYIIKLADKDPLYSFFIETEKLNLIFIPVREGSSTTTTTTPTTITSLSNNPYATLLNSDSLYNLDSDNDGLANFEEYYIWKTDPYKLDSDNDGYNDLLEIKNNYNPNGYGRYYYDQFSYGKPRVWSPSVEKDKAAYLNAELVYRMGRDIGVNAADWSTLVNAYIYGGYSIEEIKNTLVYGPGQVHPTIPAVNWRKR